MAVAGFDLLSVLSGLAAAGLVLALWSIALILWRRRRAALQKKLEQRLAPERAGPQPRERTLRLWHEGQEATLRVRRAPHRLSLRDRLERLRKGTGLRRPLQTVLILLAMAAAGAALLLYTLTGRFVPALVGAAVVMVGTWWWLDRRMRARSALFERQLVDGLELSARALRAGHPLIGSFELIAEEVPAPLGTIFREIVQQQAMGVRLDDALRRAALITDNPDMKLFSAALAIQLRTGGNLADLMQGIATVIRERMRLGRRFRVLIAQTQFSKRVLLVMPFAVLAAFSIISQEYIGELVTTRMGNVMMFVAALSLLLGWFVMNRMSRLTV